MPVPPRCGSPVEAPVPCPLFMTCRTACWTGASWMKRRWSSCARCARGGLAQQRSSGCETGAAAPAARRAGNASGRLRVASRLLMGASCLLSCHTRRSCCAAGRAQRARLFLATSTPWWCRSQQTTSPQPWRRCAGQGWAGGRCQRGAPTSGRTQGSLGCTAHPPWSRRQPPLGFLLLL